MIKLLKNQVSTYDSYLALYFLIKKLGLLGAARINYTYIAASSG
jgi:hypothetical protein